MKPNDKERVVIKGMWKENSLYGNVKVSKGNKEKEVKLGNELVHIDKIQTYKSLINPKM